MKNIPWYRISKFSSSLIAPAIFILAIYFAAISYMQLGNEERLYKIKSEVVLPTQELLKLIKKQEKTSAIADDGMLYQDLGLVQLEVARRYGYESEKGSKLLKSSVQNLERGTSLSPARSIGWIRLAYAKMLLDGPSEYVSNAIYMSAVTAPYNYDILFYRLKLAIIVWKYFNDEQRDLLLQQVRIGHSANKRRMLTLKESKRGNEILLEALSGN